MSEIRTERGDKFVFDRGNITNFIKTLRKNQDKISYNLIVSGDEVLGSVYTQMFTKTPKKKKYGNLSVYPVLTNYAKYALKSVMNPLRITKDEVKGINFDYKDEELEEKELSRTLELFHFNISRINAQKNVVCYAIASEIQTELSNYPPEQRELAIEKKERLQYIRSLYIKEPVKLGTMQPITNMNYPDIENLRYNYLVNLVKGKVIENKFITSELLEVSRKRMFDGIDFSRLKNDLSEDEYAVAVLIITL